MVLSFSNIKHQWSKQNYWLPTRKQGEKKGSVSAMLGSKGGVKRVAVIGLGKKDDSSLTPASLEAIGTQVHTARPW